MCVGEYVSIKLEVGRKFTCFDSSVSDFSKCHVITYSYHLTFLVANKVRNLGPEVCGRKASLSVTCVSVGKRQLVRS